MNIIYNKETGTFKCPKCKSSNVWIKSGLMSDLYTCNECGYESRDLDYE